MGVGVGVGVGETGKAEEAEEEVGLLLCQMLSVRGMVDRWQ